MAFEAGAAAAEPVHDPESGSYYDLIQVPKMCGVGREYCTMMWRSARKDARKRTYKGMRGRLAIIHSKRVHQLLAKNFQLTKPFHPAWIGMRYWCLTKALEWDDGTVLQKASGAFMPWNVPWHRGSACGAQYMPVAYLPNFRWQAAGQNVGYPHYFIEYPTENKTDLTNRQEDDPDRK